MDTIDRYREIVQRILLPYQERRYAFGEIQNEAVFDIMRDRYVVMSVGRDHAGIRVDAPLIHIDIIDGKVWLQRDNTSDIIAEELIAAGIPKSEIVLGFHEPEVRPHTGYAVA